MTHITKQDFDRPEKSVMIIRKRWPQAFSGKGRRRIISSAFEAACSVFSYSDLGDLPELCIKFEPMLDHSAQVFNADTFNQFSFDLKSGPDFAVEISQADESQTPHRYFKDLVVAIRGLSPRDVMVTVRASNRYDKNVLDWGEGIAQVIYSKIEHNF